MSEPRRCQAIKPSGGRCERLVGQSQDYCYSHDPQRREERREHASTAAKAKSVKTLPEIADIKARLKTLSEEVKEGEIDRADASTIAQILGVYRGFVETELKARAQLVDDERIAALEEQIVRLNSSSSSTKESELKRRWGSW